jgi:hypothetical protein
MPESLEQLDLLLMQRCGLARFDAMASIFKD